MEMKEVISYIGVNRGKGPKVSLDRMKWLMDQLGHPEKKSKFIHIAGTNGKGSTSAFLFSILREAGLQVGLFVSPHLEKINERIRINDTLITDEEFQIYTEKVAKAVDQFEEKVKTEHYFAFEILTAVAFCYFADKSPDIVILETGIGGRLDSTNVITTPEMSVITSIGIDHIGLLGDTVEDIAREKVDILKAGGQMVSGPVPESVREVMDEHAQLVGGQIEYIDRQSIQMTDIASDHQTFAYQGGGPFTIHMMGPHQVENACVALKASQLLADKGWPLNDEIITKGLAKGFWPGRFEKIHENPLVYLDGAHNLPGVEKLMETIRIQFPSQKFTFVIGMMRDKQFEDMIELSLPLAEKYLVTSPDEQRGFDAEEIAAWLRDEKHVEAIALPSVDEIKNYIEKVAHPDEIIIQFGSLYLVGALRAALK